MVNGTPPAAESESLLPDPFEIVSIRSVAAPRGTVGDDWYRYEITQGPNRIIGYRAGRIENVTQAVEFIVFGLNQRRKQKRGRVHVLLGQRPGAKAAN